MNLNDLQEISNFNLNYIPKEQREMAEYLFSLGYNIFIEGPYSCGYHKKKYCYLWAVHLTNNDIKKINDLGYDERV